MVPFLSVKGIDEDPLQVFTEPYSELIVSESGFIPFHFQVCGYDMPDSRRRNSS